MQHADTKPNLQPVEDRATRQISLHRLFKSPVEAYQPQQMPAYLAWHHLGNQQGRAGAELGKQVSVHVLGMDGCCAQHHHVRLLVVCNVSYIHTQRRQQASTRVGCAWQLLSNLRMVHLQSRRTARSSCKPAQANSASVQSPACHPCKRLCVKNVLAQPRKECFPRGMHLALLVTAQGGGYVPMLAATQSGLASR